MKNLKYKDYSRSKPINKNCKRLNIKCDYCNNLFYESLSKYNKKKKHFCSMKCYALFKKEIQPLQEQNAYKGIRKEGEGKQIYHRRYVANHKINMAHLKARRYAREKGAIGNHSLKEWDNLKILNDNKCAICKEVKKLTKDHIIPLSKGGSDFIENIQPLCKNCNSKKHNKLNYENPELLKKGV